MIGWTLGRYFLLRFLVLTGWFFLGVALLVFIISFTEIGREMNRRLASTEQISMGWALLYATFQTPVVMQQAVPFLCLISAIATLISLNRKYELVVARAAGISAWQFLTPLCLGAALFGLAAILVLNPIAAHGLARTQTMQVEVQPSRSSGAGQGPGWIKQRTEEGETYIGAGAVAEDGRLLLRPVFLRISPDGILSERIDARTARLTEGQWLLNEVVRQHDGQMRETRDSMTIPTTLTPEFLNERLVDPETVSFLELPRKISAARSFGLSANGFATQFHSLLALPALLISMTLIAATVSMRFARMGQSATMILGGAMAGFLLYVVTVLVKAFGSTGIVPPVAAAWFPVVAAGFFGVTFLLYKEDG
jgi:lipopolysaccharide export system permease protein